MIGYSSNTEPPEPYADDAPCDRCGHRYADHVSIIGCDHNAEQNGNGVKFDCPCGEFQPAYINGADLPDKGEVEAEREGMR